LVGGTQMQASPQQLPLLAMSSPHCLEEIAATGSTMQKWGLSPSTFITDYHQLNIALVTLL